MSNGYKAIFWGFVFLTFRIDFGEFSIISNFISYSLIYYGLKIISRNKNIKDLNESAKCCAILILMSLIVEYLSLGGTDIFIKNPIFHIVWISLFGILKLAMIYKFLNGNSEILKDKDNNFSSSYEKRSYIYVILALVLIVISNVNVALMIPSIWRGIAISEFVLNLWIVICSNKLKKICI